ncbi:GNAT family N-acetyltransferase [Photobacterium sp. BZF1]|uniref:GNAT family N-acetyltransferase n=1 Tax=Photobacterium sp. BZF1 TaxID=1904457 RepID=UPI001CA39106|nr:GNAT family N-acetyltransferase [Photobacterium sp. BZF1]
MEARAAPNFFLSWLWIGTWLKHFVSDFSVIEARNAGVTVGLGILINQKTHSSLFGLRAKYYLHRTGVISQDQVWIEYNDFLMVAGDESRIRTAMASCVVHSLDKREALVIGASDDGKFSCINQLGLHERKVWETRNYSLDLHKLRQTNQSVLETLSRNARYQIQRSIRNYQKFGGISVTKASNAAEAHDMLLIAKPYHLARWGGKEQCSGFANPEFVAFHEELIAEGIKSGAIELNHIKAGDETIAVIYNFKYGNHVYFYLCAINYSHSGAQFKPGMVSHYLLIEKALEEGLESYDFMGGTARYKATFSNRQGALSVCQYEHQRPSLIVENALRRVKQRFLPSEMSSGK